MCDPEDVIESAEMQELKAVVANAYLSYIRDLGSRERALRLEIDRERESMLPGGVSYEGIMSGGEPKADAIPEAVAKVCEMIQDYCEELDAYIAAKREAHDCIRKVSRGEYQAILSGYYLAGKTWDQVSEEVGYSKSQVLRLKRVALVEVYDLMPHQWRLPSYPAL